MATLLRHRWSIEDYHRIVEAGVLADTRCELLNGEIVDMAPEGPEHAQRCETSARYLERCFGEGWWARQGKPITLAESEPEPDVAIVEERDYSTGHPLADEIALVVEYAFSSQQKDQGIKRDIYAQAGIPHYLVIDLRLKSVRHYAEPVNGVYEFEQDYTQGVIEMAGREISVDRLLRSAR
jgi:Uma2 family endonuclease